MKKIFGTLAIMAIALTGAGCVHAHGGHHPHSQTYINYNYHPGTVHTSYKGHAPKQQASKFHGQKPQKTPTHHQALKPHQPSKNILFLD